ncbi:MAG: outer membrane lipoprotein carrier protein LolA [Gemmatimonadota bacterium]
MRRILIGAVAAVFVVGLIYGSWSIFDVDVADADNGASAGETRDGARRVNVEPPPAADGDAADATDTPDGQRDPAAPGGTPASGAPEPANRTGGAPASGSGTTPATTERPADPNPADLQEPQDPQDPALVALRRAAAAYEDVRALSADFVLTAQNPLLRSTSTSRGTLFQRSPDRLLLRFSEPAGDRVVVDGTWIWTYYPSADSSQVIRTSAGQGTGGVDLRAQFIGEPERRFAAERTGTEAVGGRQADVLKLLPRERAAYRELRVWVDRQDGLARRFEIVEANGAVRRFDLSGLRVNPNLADDLFRFEPPPGVRVITAG